MRIYFRPAEPVSSRMLQTYLNPVVYYITFTIFSNKKEQPDLLSVPALMQDYYRIAYI